MFEALGVTKTLITFPTKLVRGRGVNNEKKKKENDKKNPLNLVMRRSSWTWRVKQPPGGRGRKQLGEYRRRTISSMEMYGCRKKGSWFRHLGKYMLCLSLKKILPWYPEPKDNHICVYYAVYCMYNLNLPS